MSNSTRKPQRKKPAKPHKDFPLFAHNNGSWCKKVRGRHHFFGGWGDPDAALQRWLDEKDDLLAGRTPRAKTGELTVKALADRFMTAKLDRVEAGELAVVSYRDILGVLKHVADVFGRQRLVDDLAADDFRELRKSFAAIHGPTRLGKEVKITRGLFKWGYENGLIDQPVRFGSDFKSPRPEVIAKAARANGRKDFSADELRRIIDAAPMPLRVMILLGANCGFGNNDIASMPQSSVDLENGWIEFARPKTQVERRCPLWPETIQALRDAMENRPKPTNKADDDIAILTDRGTRVVRITERARTDTVGYHFEKLLKELDISGKRGFYGLRHTFETRAGESRDQVAVDRIMGHKDPSMAANYRHHISDARLQDVVGVVHRWLFGEPVK